MSLLKADQLADVDAFADEFITSADKADPDVEEWENKHLGRSPVHRLSRIGRDAVDLRVMKKLDIEKATGLEVKEDPKVLETREQSQWYFHQSGRQAMEMQLYHEEEAQATQVMKTKSVKSVKLLRKKIKVSENEEGGDSTLSIDQDWDTSTWKHDDITAGMDYLLYVFVDPKYKESDIHKKMAITMIDKMLTRHWQAEYYLRDKMEAIVARAISRFIRNGRSAAQLNLINIIHVGKDKYIKELSLFNFSGRSFEMMSVECRLAAILIQHTFRSFKSEKNVKIRKTLPISETFGGNLEMRFLREAAVRARSKELREAWHVFHEKQSKHEINTPSGYRGPCHMEKQLFVIMLLEIALSLVGPSGGTKSHMNREDMVMSNSSIMLANFASYPLGPFARLAIKICSYTCKISRSLQPMLEAGVAMACVRYIDYLEDMGLLKWIVEGKDNLPNRKDMSKLAYEETQIPKRSFFDCILIITRLAVHAAGCFRAKDKYDTIIAATEDVEEIDYRKTLASFTVSYTPKLVRTVLGQKRLIKCLGSVILRCNHLYCMRSLLLCFYSISCGEATGPVMFEMVFDAGKIMERVLSMIEEEDLTTATLATCIFLQLATTEGARETMMCAYIPKYLGPYTRCTGNFDRLSYIRGCLINASLLRQSEWRSYDPELHPGKFSSASYMRNAVYIDLLVTSRNVPQAAAAKAGIADLIVLPPYMEACKDFSIAAEMIGARELTDFLVHPGDLQHTDHLPAEEAIGGCVIIDAMCTHIHTASSVFSPETVTYLGRCLFIFRWMFAGAPMSERQLLMIFQGVRSASRALRFLATGIKYDLQREAKMLFALPDLVDPVRYFIGNLGIKQEKIENTSKAALLLQRDANIEVMKYMRCHVDMIIRGGCHGTTLAAQMLQYAPVGVEILKVVKNCNDLYDKEGNTVFLSVLEPACAILEVISQSESGAKIVSAQWRSGEAMKKHLPKPLSGVGPLGIDETHYKTGLARMGPSLFRLLANLCLTDAGKSDCLSDGFLRRALDKFDILYPVVMKELDPTGTIDARPIALSKLSEDIQYKALEVSGCLMLISRCCNFASQIYGSSNDLILQPFYEIMIRTHRIISRCDKVPWDVLMDSAFLCISKLSCDNVRLLNTFEKIDILEMIRKVCLQIGNIPETALSLCCKTVSVVASSLRTDYLKANLPLLREPLAAIPNKHPALLEEVRAASWEVMKCVIDLEKLAAAEKKKGKQPESGMNINWKYANFASTNDRITNEKLQNLLRQAGLDPVGDVLEMVPSAMNTARDQWGSYAKGTGPTAPTTTTTTTTGAGVNMSSSMSTSASVPSLPLGGSKDLSVYTSPIKNNMSFTSIPDEDPVMDKAGHLVLSDIGPLTGDITGSEFICGPTSCGSLRIPHQPHEHGEFDGMSVKDNIAFAASQSLLKESSGPGNGNMPMTDFSARDPKLKSSLLSHKTHKGFVEKVRQEPFNAETALHAVNSPIRRRQGQGQGHDLDSRAHDDDNILTIETSNHSHSHSHSHKAVSHSLSPSQFNTKPLHLSPKNSPKPAPGVKGKGKGHGKKKLTHSPVRAPLVVDISECPQFLESRPPVFKVKADEAFIC